MPHCSQRWPARGRQRPMLESKSGMFLQVSLPAYIGSSHCRLSLSCFLKRIHVNSHTSSDCLLRGFRGAGARMHTVAISSDFLFSIHPHKGSIFAWSWGVVSAFQFLPRERGREGGREGERERERERESVCVCVYVCVCVCVCDLPIIVLLVSMNNLISLT